MKLVSFRSQNLVRVGVRLGGNEILDLASAESKIFSDTVKGDFENMLSLIRAGDPALERAHACIERAPSDAVVRDEDVKLLAPLPIPPRLRDAGMFVEHIEVIRKEMARMAAEFAPDPVAKMGELLQSEQFKVPQILFDRVCYYNGNHHAIIGPDDELQWPDGVNVIDYELELAVIVGKGGAPISADDARGHVFGYTIMNDWSARDIQIATSKSGAGPCMGKDFGTSLGPCIVTADELPDPHSLGMIARLNGEELSRGSTTNMQHGVFEALAEFGRLSPLVSGEVIGSGTPAYGSASEKGRRLVRGDVVQLEIDGIGILENRIAN